MGHAAEGGGVTEHVGERNFARRGELLVTGLGVDDGTLTLVDATDDGTFEKGGMSIVGKRREGSTSRRTLELDRRDDVNLHDRLENDGTTLGEGLAEGALSSKTESHLGGIDLVSRSVLEDEFATRDGVASEDTALEGILETL